MPEFQQYLKNGQCQWSRIAWRLPSVLPVRCSYSSSSDSYRRCNFVLVLVLFQKPIRSWKLVADVTHLFFSDMLMLCLVFILGPFARSGLSPLLVTAAHGSRHVNLECQNLAFRSKIRQLQHVSLWEWLTVHLHRVLGLN